MSSPAPATTNGTATPTNTSTTTEHNKKWKHYLLISTTSLVNFVSLGDVFDIPFIDFFHSNTYSKAMNVNLMFGIVTFLTPLLILLFDLVSYLRNKIDFQNAKDGKVEGYTLSLHVLWWIIGTASMTRAGGLGYRALNVYFSSWASLFACIYALDAWGAEREILTIRELTRLSITLPAWWMVLWSSIVTFASAADAMSIVKTPSAEASCEFAVAVGVISACISALFVLSHYEFLSCCEACKTSSWLTYGGWFELACSLLVNLWHIIGLDQLTSAGQISSTLVGQGNNPDSLDYIPGTNIYLSIWIGFISSVMVTVRWKEARAIKFAQTSEREAEEDVEEGLEVGDKDDDDDDGSERDNI